MLILSILLLFGVSFALPQEKAQSEEYESCGEAKLCVPNFLCQNGEIVTDGANIIDTRFPEAKSNSSQECRQTSSWDETECRFLGMCCKTPYKAPIITKPLEFENYLGCGHRNRDGIRFQISIGDTEAQYGEFPWMVAILSEHKDSQEATTNLFECGGSLIAPTVIVTGAHCMKDRSANSLFARAGEWDTQTKDEFLPTQDRRGQEIILHEKFNKSSLFNNIALLIVDSPFEYEENVQPICLPPQNTNFDLARCYATGWGKDKFGEESKYQVILKKIDLPVMPRDRCQANLRTTRLGKLFDLHESFICAGGELSKDTCLGDGGSPLVCPIVGKNDQFYQAGIVAWGIGCGKENIPGVYTNVAHFRPWINEKLIKMAINFRHFTPE